MPAPDETPAPFAAGFLDDYFAECDEHLTEVRRILLAAETVHAGDLTPAAVGELFRSFHTVKGLSGMVELRDAEVIAHEMEALLRPLRQSGARSTSAMVDALIRGTQVLEQVIVARREHQPPPSVEPIVEFLRTAAGAASGSPAEQERTPSGGPAAPRWRAVFTPSATLAERGVNVDHVRKLLASSAEIVDAAPRIGADGSITFEFTLERLSGGTDSAAWLADGVALAEIVAPPPAPPAPDAFEASGTATASSLGSAQFVRVDLARLDDLMRIAGDLVISRARLTESLLPVEAQVRAFDWRIIQENGLSVERHVRDLREAVMRLRLVRVGDLFRRMSLVVRDLARETGKKVDLDIHGEDTEIDKFLVERMVEPILHLVRNAVSHGIDAPDARVARGKPETGRITLTAASVGDVVTLEVADDGEGVDVEAVARRARAAGLAVPDGELEGAALLDILCAPGFSTRDAADLAAGRGVGMGVVQSTTRELGGAFEIDTAPGEGTRFILQLPVSLAIADAIIASVGSQLFAVPQSSVREVIEVESSSVRALEKSEVAPYRGAILPLVRLGAAFGLQPTPGRSLHVFVVGYGTGTVGLVVDRIRGQREVVVRPMADPLVKVPGITGATDLGDGRVVLILDLAAIARMQTLHSPRVANVRGR